MNILPVVELTMPVSNDANVAVPASISADWDVFGASGSANYPLGDLYTLDNGDQTFDYDADFYGSQFYSVPLVYTINCVAVACFPPVYETPASGPGPTTVSNGIPIDIPPSVTITGSGPVPGGYGNTNLGPLFQGDPSTGNICGPVGTRTPATASTRSPLRPRRSPVVWSCSESARCCSSPGCCGVSSFIKGHSFATAPLAAPISTIGRRS